MEPGDGNDGKLCETKRAKAWRPTGARREGKVKEQWAGQERGEEGANQNGRAARGAQGGGTNGKKGRQGTGKKRDRQSDQTEEGSGEKGGDKANARKGAR